jgi:hypothetical protein
MNRMSILAALLALAGSCASASVVTLGTFAVNPQSTFLYESNDSNVAALFINLTCPPGVTTDCVNVSPGTTLQIIALGGLCYFTGPCNAESPASLGGVFDSNNTLLASSSLTPCSPQPNCTGGNVDRLTGSINAGASNAEVSHNPSLNTYYGDVDTTIPNDFFVPTGSGITVVVPNGAAYFVVGVLDSYYADNSDPAHELGVQINEITQNPPSTPEPPTLALLAIGIAGFLTLRRYLPSTIAN